VKAGLDLRQLVEGQRDQFFMALLTSLIRAGLVDDAMRMLRDAYGSGLVKGAELCTSAVKLLTSKHHFQEGLEIHDLVKKSQISAQLDKSVWSCLLFCAIETKALSSCAPIFEKLKAVGPPSQKDYWNMVRCGSIKGDWKMMLQIVHELRSQAMEVDNVIYNTVLATCVSADEISEARKLLQEMDTVGAAPDVITYNTLIKGYAKRGHFSDCFELYELMRKRGLTPSQVTYGILLDGCVNNNEVEKAAGVFDLMKREGCPMNTVLYTTMIKGFAREQKLDEAMRVFRHMQDEKDITPDLITFSILLKANFDAGRLEDALKLVDTMQKMNVKPDEVIFNNLLSGCAKLGNAQLARQLYTDMVASNIKPSTATFSILIRLFSQCKLLDEAYTLLRTEPQKYNMEVEPRLFSQLIQACIRQRQGRRAVEVYELMYSHCKPNAAMHNSVLGMCVKLNMFDTAAELLAVAAAKGGNIDARDGNLVLEGAVRKKKDSSINACVTSMKALGLAVDPSLMARLA
jgi:pentatricopeptide repeat protein